MVGESLENFSLEGVQQQGETVKKAWVGWHKSEVANIHQSESLFQNNELKGEEVIESSVTPVFQFVCSNNHSEWNDSVFVSPFYKCQQLLNEVV